MSTPFLGQLKIVSFDFPPRGWALCNGQLLSIDQNAALFSLLGTTYGGDGETTFGLPNLQGCVPVHAGNGLSLGDFAGETDLTLIVDQIPGHNHSLIAVSDAATAASPNNNLLATTPIKGMGSIYGVTPDGTVASGGAISPSGGSQPHENRQPFIVVNFIIALEGIFPSRN
jgi:microcystin-dependent protein